jgi:putative ABC transport system substrate-binding protein
MIRRRDFIAALGGVAAWPLAARAQQGDRVRRIGVLLGGATDSDPTYEAWMAAFRDALAKLGWIEGRNLEIDLRRVPNGINRIRAQAAEIVKLMPEAIFAASGAATLAAHLETQTIPIVAICGDAILSALARSIGRPEGNVTGFAILYPSIAGKWVQLLKEVQPHLARVAYVHNNNNPEAEAGAGAPSVSLLATVYRGPIQAATQALGIETIDAPFRNTAELESVIAAFAKEPNGGLILGPASTNGRDIRQSILLPAVQHPPARHPLE